MYILYSFQYSIFYFFFYSNEFQPVSYIPCSILYSKLYSFFLYYNIYLAIYIFLPILFFYSNKLYSNIYLFFFFNIHLIFLTIFHIPNYILFPRNYIPMYVQYSKLYCLFFYPNKLYSNVFTSFHIEKETRNEFEKNLLFGNCIPNQMLFDSKKILKK